jgi:hypothetical protein
LMPCSFAFNLAIDGPAIVSFSKYKRYLQVILMTKYLFCQFFLLHFNFNTSETIQMSSY